MTFLCKIINKIDDVYIVELDSTNFTNYPVSNISKRKIVLLDDIQINTIICVLDFEKLDSAVKVNKYCILSDPIIPTQIPTVVSIEELSKELIELISDTKTYPISILKYVQSNS
jgi:hypothetical protein